jgi:hypothetical protein
MGVLVAEAACASQILANCPNLPGSIYPRFVKVQTPPLQPQRTMPDPCAGVPANPWCPAASASIAASPSGHVVGGEVTWRSRRTVIR